MASDINKAFVLLLLDRLRTSLLNDWPLDKGAAEGLDCHVSRRSGDHLAYRLTLLKKEIEQEK